MCQRSVDDLGVQTQFKEVLKVGRVTFVLMNVLLVNVEKFILRGLQVHNSNISNSNGRNLIRNNRNRNRSNRNNRLLL